MILSKMILLGEAVTATIRETNATSDTFLCILGKLSTITDPGGKTKWCYSSFPEKLIDNKSAYPLIIINSPEISYNPLTFTNIKKGPVNLVIDIYSTSAEQADTICDSIIDKMETNEKNFMISGINTMRLTGTFYDHFPRESFRVHNKKLRYQFDFWWF